jgi:hypothetical protein
MVEEGQGRAECQRCNVCNTGKPYFPSAAETTHHAFMLASRADGVEARILTGGGRGLGGDGLGGKGLGGRGGGGRVGGAA